jgi:hypothetical protein
MIGGYRRVKAFRKSNEDSLERRAGNYGSSRKRRKAVKYTSTVPYPKILRPDVF